MQCELKFNMVKLFQCIVKLLTQCISNSTNITDVQSLSRRQRVALSAQNEQFQNNRGVSTPTHLVVPNRAATFQVVIVEQFSPSNPQETQCHKEVMKQGAHVFLQDTQTKKL